MYVCIYEDYSAQLNPVAISYHDMVLEVKCRLTEYRILSASTSAFCTVSASVRSNEQIQRGADKQAKAEDLLQSFNLEGDDAKSILQSKRSSRGTLLKDATRSTNERDLIAESNERWTRFSPISTA